MTLSATNETSLCIGQTPLQVLNLVEACLAKGVEAEFVVLWRSRRIQAQMAALLSDLGVRRVTFLRVSGLPRLWLPFKLARLCLRLRGSVRRVFFGTYTSWVAVLVNLLGPEETTMVDDGQKTINILTAPHLAGLPGRAPWPLSRSFVQSASLFTFYDALATRLGRAAQPNRLTRVTELLRRSDVHGVEPLRSDEVLFIGTHIAHLYGRFEEDLQQVLASSDGRPVTYVLHRRDDEEGMRHLGQRLGFKVVRYDVPLELAFNAIWAPHHPEVWTFGTTATDTLTAMHDQLRVKVFRLDTSAFVRPRTGSAFSSTYKHYEGNDRVMVVPIPESNQPAD
ncbi:MAG: hypothetical protein P8R43_04090 [Planctomycetota bacterium]|nr:hypothetical protein [Planctomycetota bacterium]